MWNLCRFFITAVLVFNLFSPSTSVYLNQLGETLLHMTLSASDIINGFPVPKDTSGNKQQTVGYSLDEKIMAVQQQMDTLNSKLYSVEVEIEAVSDFIRHIPNLIKLELNLNDLLKNIADLNIWYQKYQYYSGNISHFENITLENFAEGAVSHIGGSVTNLIQQIHTYISPPETVFGDRGILIPFSKMFQRLEGNDLCSVSLSPQQLLYNIYNYIALIEMKGYIMMEFSYMLLRLCNKGKFTVETEILKKTYSENSQVSLKYLKQVMGPLSRELWTCDPKVHIQGETYTEVTQLLQGYIQNEVDLNPTGTCSNQCEMYTSTDNYGCYEDLCQRQRQCRGKLVKCRTIDMATTADICHDISNSGNRYSCLKLYSALDIYGYKEVAKLGCKQNCSTSPITRVQSWNRGFVKCDYCFCLCDEQGDHSDRYFNLRPVMSDIKNNSVVTGLRFVKNNRIIHIQIQEGHLLPNGDVDPDTLRWIPVDNYKITDNNVYSGKDYHTLSFSERKMILDNLLAKELHVVTGIGFYVVESHLNFAIHTTRFNFSTGVLSQLPEDSIWKYNHFTDGDAKFIRSSELKLDEPDVSTLSPLPSLPDSKENEYIEFTNTDVHKDVAQRTVPFLDTQPTKGLLPVALGGVGIYHKGVPGYGGFIAPKLITYDFTSHL